MMGNENIVTRGRSVASLALALAPFKECCMRERFFRLFC